MNKKGLFSKNVSKYFRFKNSLYSNTKDLLIINYLTIFQENET